VFSPALGVTVVGEEALDAETGGLVRERLAILGDLLAWAAGGAR
jgi:hypothetical protein